MRFTLCLIPAICFVTASNPLNIPRTRQPTNSPKSLSPSDLDLLDQLLLSRSSGPTYSTSASNTESTQDQKTYNLAVFTQPELSVCCQMFLRLLKDPRSLSGLRECYEDDFGPGFTLVERKSNEGTKVEYRLFSNPDSSLLDPIQLSFILLDSSSQDSIGFAARTLARLRARDQRCCICFLLARDHYSPQLERLVVEHFNSRTMVAVLDDALTGPRVWSIVAGLEDMYEANRDSSETLQIPNWQPDTGHCATSTSFKNQKTRGVSAMHPRNTFSKDYPVFHKLARQYPDLKKQRKVDGTVSLNFADPEASRTLAKAVLMTEYGLDVELPKGNLIPTIPNRLDYILWIEDLLIMAGIDENAARGIDIGTGASCIYPLLACKLHPEWTFKATDVDEKSCLVARKNVASNGFESRITVIHTTDPKQIIMPAVTGSEGGFAFCMTNPPFYDGQADLDECRKLKSNPSPEIIEYTDSEYFFEGGEAAFIELMIQESLKLKDQIIWYTSIVAKKSNLKPLKRLIKSHEEIKTFNWTRFIQGTTSRWAIAWSFLDIDVPNPAAEKRKKKKKMLLLTGEEYQEIILKFEASENDDLLQLLSVEMTSLGIETLPVKDRLISQVRFNTWCRKSRRGHPAPECPFEMVTERRQDQIRFVLRTEGQSESFVSLVSHLQKKFGLKK